MSSDTANVASENAYKALEDALYQYWKINDAPYFFSADAIAEFKNNVIEAAENYVLSNAHSEGKT